MSQERNAEDQEAVDDGGEPHGNCTEEHRDDGMPEDASGAVEEEDPARGVKKAEQHEEPDVEEPQGNRDSIETGNCDRELVQRQSQDAGSHRHGEPIRRELAHDLPQPARGGRRACHFSCHF